MGWISNLEEADAARLSAGPAPQQEIERETPVVRRYVPRRCRRLWIERDTPIVPSAVASAVLEEASVWLDVELPREWIRRLAVRADVIYFHNPRFRQSIRRKGNAGLNYLRAFTRHWLAAMIRKRSPHLYARLSSCNPEIHSATTSAPPSCRHELNA